MKKTVYLASPLGFAESTRGFMEELISQLHTIVNIENPWDDERFVDEFNRLAQVDSYAERVATLHDINTELGRSNAERIQRSDALIAILDGVDVDSGTAAEIGYAFALEKRIYGLRTDFRLAGDNIGAIVNLQVQYFIEASGGRTVTTVDELLDCAAKI